MKTHHMTLYPLHECAEAANKLVQSGVNVYQQFNCEKCRMKQTMGEENVFFTHGKCEECGHVTDIVKNGCNYMTIARREL